MRLLAPGLFLLLGAVVGALLSMLFGAWGAGMRVGAAAGVLGGFAGLWLRDVFDIDLGEVFLGSLIAVTVGALCASLIANLLARVHRGGF